MLNRGQELMLKVSLGVLCSTTPHKQFSNGVIGDWSMAHETGLCVHLWKWTQLVSMM